MKVPVESTVNNFNASTEILYIQHDALVKEVGTLKSVNLSIVLVDVKCIVWCYLSHAPHLSISIHIDESGTLYYNEGICIVLESFIHEEVRLVDHRPGIFIGDLVETRPIYNGPLAKP